MESKVVDLLDDAADASGLIVVLTGAGISAESGIPTFRGEEGYWTVGSEVYHPQELATARAFASMPWNVWSWYLYRLGVCNAASPNRAHNALARLERRLGDRVRIITQNVDGLHLRAGSSMARTYQIHGNIEFMRCADSCTPELRPIPPEIGLKTKGGSLAQPERELLVCRRCGGLARPHVLWFDETYDEPLFRFESSLRAAREASMLITVGTSATTNLPNHVVQLAVKAGASLIDVNPERNPFSETACALTRGHWVQTTAAESVPAMVDLLVGDA